MDFVAEFPPLLLTSFDDVLVRDLSTPLSQNFCSTFCHENCNVVHEQFQHLHDSSHVFPAPANVYPNCFDQLVPPAESLVQSGDVRAGVSSLPASHCYEPHIPDKGVSEIPKPNVRHPGLQAHGQDVPPQHRVRSTKGGKASARRENSLAESLRRKRMSKWFSKLELLLPEEDVLKVDKCSLIDAAIQYISSLQKRVAEASQTSNPANASSKCRKVEIPNQLTREEGTRYPRTTNCSIVDDEQGSKTSVISVTADSKYAFVNAVTFNGDALLLSRMLTVMSKHNLELLSATLSRGEEATIYAVHATIPESVELHIEGLKDQLKNLVAQQGLN